MSFLQNLSKRKLNIAKAILVVLGVTLAVADAYFAFTDNPSTPPEKKFPTFSRLHHTYQTQLLWFDFVLGCLVSKIFYNRRTPHKKHELRGILMLSLFILVWVSIGNLFFYGKTDVPTEIAICIFLSGIFASHWLWPQYGMPESST